MSASELKRCPFCGCKKVTVRRACFYHVECDDCFASSSYKKSKKEAIAAWNRRAVEGEGK